jgi:hypothetical protein
MFRWSLVLTIVGLALLQSAAGTDAQARRPDADVILSGEAPWGRVELFAKGDRAEGSISGGKASVFWSADKIWGKSAWGAFNLAHKDDVVAGSFPWGPVTIKIISATAVSGTGPWGKFELALRGREVTGQLPWGPVNLRLGSKFRSFKEPQVVAAIVAVLADNA